MWRSAAPPYCATVPGAMRGSSGWLRGPHTTATPAVIGTILLLTAAAHVYLSRIDFLAHSSAVPLLLIPVSYFASAYGAWGGVVATALSGLVLVDDVTEGRPGHTLLEISQLGAFAVWGVVLGSLVTVEKEESARLLDREVTRIGRLRFGAGYWDQVAVTAVGLYVTRAESAFIEGSLRTAPRGVILDVGAGAGRLEPTLIRESERVIATEADRDMARSIGCHPQLQPLLVSATSTSLPLANQSVDWVVCVEVPAVSDKDWFRAECARVLRPGGGVVVTVHNAASYKGLWRRLAALARLAPDGDRQTPYYGHSVGSLQERWREDGFDLEAAVGFYWPPLPRDSNSPLLYFFAASERLLGLGRLVWLSPWVLLRLRRRLEPPPICQLL